MSNFINWKNIEAGTKFVGNYVKRLEFDSNYKDANGLPKKNISYVIETIDGKESCLTGTASLNKTFEKINIGQPVSVEFKGKVDLGKGRSAYDFGVKYGDYVSASPVNKTYGTNS